MSIHSLAFRILSTAEIEHFVEDRCEEVAKTALHSWRSRKHLSPTLLSLASFSGLAFPPPPDTVNRPPSSQKDWDDLVSPNQRLERCVSQYIRLVTKENHGVREKNLMKLLVPIGIDLRAVDPSFVSGLDNLGSLRGDAAHTSTSQAIRVGVDPATELQRVSMLKSGLRDLDTLLDGLLQASQ